MKYRVTILLTLLYLAPYQLKAQTPKTLLWKITGSQFAKPCYLYGTIHIGDKRVYYLGDSVYSSIQNCNGFAMEVDPGELTDTLFNEFDNAGLEVQYRQSVERDLGTKTDPSYLANRKRNDSLMQIARQRFRDLTPGDVRRLERVYRRRKKNDMRTLLDLFLFDLAKKQGKVLSGIEDMTDQTSIKDELGNPFSADDFLKNQRKKYPDLEEWMIKTYVAADLDQLNDFHKQTTTGQELTTTLFNRNNKMARRIDSLGRNRSTFCAIGAAHLPGDSGVISLLRKRGLTVTPVFSTRFIDPGDINPNSSTTILAIADEDSNYLVQLPGKATTYTPITNRIVLRTYKELANDILLMYGVIAHGDLSKTATNEFDEIKKFFSWYDIKLYSSKKITRQQQEGYELHFKNHEGYIRMDLFCNKGKTYFFAAGSKDKDSIDAVKCLNFLGSYKMILDRPQVANAMIPFDAAEKGFGVSFPTAPKKEYIAGDATSTKEAVSLFTSIDNKKMISYLVMLKEPSPGYFMNYDSAVFVQTVQEISSGVFVTGRSTEQVLLDGYPALKIKMTAQQAGKTQVIYSILGFHYTRFFNLTVRGLPLAGNTELFNNFFTSFHFLPYLEADLQQQKGGNNLFTVMSPSPVYKMDIEPGGRSVERQQSYYYALDSNTAMTYNIIADRIHPYYWAANEKELLENYGNIEFNDTIAINNVLDTDSLLYKRNVQNGGIAGKELLLKNISDRSYSRIRIMHYADSVFVINIKGPKELVTDENADAFFNSFRFVIENYTSDAFIPKTALLVKALESKDQEKRSVALTVLKTGFRFPAGDRKILLDALLNKYPEDEDDVYGLLMQAASGSPGEDLFAFIRENYPAVKKKREDLRTLMINTLSACACPSGFELLKKFLVNDPPQHIDAELLAGYFAQAPALALTLFPDLDAKLEDEQLGPLILDVSNMLIDSNKIQLSSVMAIEDQLMRVAKKLLKRYKDDNISNNYIDNTSGALKLLAKMARKPARQLLDDFLDLHNNRITEEVIVALAKNNEAVPKEIINGFATLPAQRIELYNELLKIGKPQFFLGTYANQSSFAEAFATLSTNREMRDGSIKTYTVTAIKDTLLSNAWSRYYILKIRCEYPYGNVNYACITGPFSTHAANLSIDPGKQAYLLYRKNYYPENNEEMFADFISSSK